MKQYDICWIDVLCNDGSGEKTRPALVVAITEVDGKFLEITSQGKSYDLQCPIDDWQGAGLSKPSYISYEPLRNVDICKIGERIGRLQLVDIFKIEPYLIYGRKYKR